MDIMQRALADLIGRKGELAESIDVARGQLTAAEEELERTVRAIAELRAAIERVENPPPKRGKKGSRKGSRPEQRRPPREGTITAQVLNTVRALRSAGAIASLGTISSRSGVRREAVRSAIDDLLDRGYVVRVSEGVYDVGSGGAT